ncbi:DUF4142 domain-containing protein [Pigmentiphaga aceris]|uniref:DUF4142 domain-containing protein n=1 Tax=Pigmentiphaga aceris TaxID=1940612 RepID=A0A5C0B237_9BURK|nr:DUF4142 domain-containing protein [Pigmentiphaga aceris]QEI07783.1 DUF4142 domain-containing protein [Pigmentiphaga aceris]
MKALKFTAASIALAIASIGAAHAELSSGDKKFLEKAAESGQLELATSQLAVERATHPDVKAFAQMMVTDHTKADTELKALAASKQVTLPMEQPRKVKSELEDLGKKQGIEFDKEYADEIAVDAHKDAVDLFKDAAEDAKDPDVKAWAAKTLPTLQAHYDAGRMLKEKLKDVK